MNKLKMTLILIAATALVIGGVNYMKGRGQKPIDSVEARSKGSAQAKVQVIEFIDFECPACAAGAKVLKEFMDKNGQDMRVQVKYFPIVRAHKYAMPTALFSECTARQGKFWEWHDQLMPQQQQWSQLMNAEPLFKEMAKNAGADLGALEACMATEEARQTIENDRSLGLSLGVQSTPTYFINNKMVVGTKALKDELETFFPPR